MRNQEDCPVCAAQQLRTLKHHVLRPEAAPNARTKRLLQVYAELFLPPGADSVNVSMEMCRNCGFIFTNPRLEESDLDRKYAAIATDDKQQHGAGHPPHLAQRRVRTTPYLQQLLRDAGRGQGGKVLDYGGAEGYLLSPLIDAGHHGFISDYVDYEREDERIHYLGQKLDGEVRAKGPYDCILLLHTLEHVADPVGLLRGLSTVLASTGRMYVEVPLGAWLEWQHLREPLTHVNFFSEQSLARAASEAGLHVHAISSDWQYVTQPEKTPCINLSVAHQPAPRPVSPARTETQMQPTHQLWDGLRVNPRYYGKLVASSYLKG